MHVEESVVEPTRTTRLPNNQRIPRTLGCDCGNEYFALKYDPADLSHSVIVPLERLAKYIISPWGASILLQQTTLFFHNQSINMRLFMIFAGLLPLAFANVIPERDTSPSVIPELDARGDSGCYPL